MVPQRALSLILLSLTGLLVGGGSPLIAAKAVVMGIAQDGGVPQIGCSQPICRSSRYLISSLALLGDQQQLYIIDATPDLRAQYSGLLARYPTHAGKTSLVDGIFLTHAHAGHYTGLLYLGKESISTNQVPVHCSSEMASFLRQNAPWDLLITNRNIRLEPFADRQSVALAGLTITPLKVPHRREYTDTHGFLIEGQRKSLLYIPDIDSWEPVRASIKQWLNRCDYALVDGSFYSGDELPGRDMSKIPHPTIVQSIDFFRSLAPFPCRIYFTHLNHTNPLLDSRSPLQKEIQASGMAIASPWQELEL